MNTRPNPRHEKLASTILKAKLKEPASASSRAVVPREGVSLAKPGSHSALLKRLFRK